MQLPYLLPRRGQNKPNGIPRINWQHPLARGLVSYCFDTGGGVVIDLVTGGVATRVATAANVPINIGTSALGQGWNYQGQGTAAETNHLEFRNSPITDHLANAPYSAACGFIQTANGTIDIGSMWAIGDTVSNVHFAMGTLNGASPVAEVAFANNVFLAGTLTVALNQYATIAANQSDPTTGNIYTVQGGNFQKDAKAPAAFFDLTGMTPMLADAQAGVATSNHLCNFFGSIFYGAAWKRVIADDEVRALHDDPWQFLIFPEDEIFATLVGVAAASTSVDRYLQPLSEPVRQRPGLSPQQQQAFARGTFPFATDTSNKTPWYGWLAEPVRLKPGLQAPLQAFATAFDPFPFPTDISNKMPWFGWLSEPVRLRPGLIAPQQPFFSYDPFPFPTSISGLMPWFAALSDPVRLPQGLRSPQQPFAGTAPFVSTPTFGWYGPLSEPVRLAQALRASLQQFFAPSAFPFPTDTSRLMPWFDPLSEPVRLLQGLKAAYQPFFTSDTAVIPVSTLMPWFAALSEPVRSRSGLIAAEQPFFTADTTVIPTSRLWWLSPWLDPQRRLGLNPAGQPFFTPSAGEFIGPDKYLRALSEPLRSRLWPQPALLAFDPFPFTLNPAQIETWLQALSEPQRQKLGLLAALQQAWSGPPRLIPGASFFAVMRAIEQFDSLLGGGTIFNKPISAETGVFEQAFPGSESGVSSDASSASGVVSASTSVYVIT